VRIASAVVRVYFFPGLAGILGERALAVAVLIENKVFTALNIRTLDLDTVADTEIPFHTGGTFVGVVAHYRIARTEFMVKETITVFSIINALTLAVGI
jgi:hypothetical protein